MDTILNTVKILIPVFALAALNGCAQEERRTPDGRIIIDYWEKWEKFEKEAMRQIVDDYNASQDKVYVNFLSVGQLDQKLLLATAGGNPPDVAGLWAWRLYSYAETGALQPLDDLMERDGIMPDDYLPSIYNQLNYRGFTWALPTTPATLALHYNREMFSEAGLDPDRPPQTLAELKEYARKLTKYDEEGEIIQLGFSPNEPGWWNDRWGYWFGGRLLNEDATQLTIDSPENVAAYEWVQSFPEEYGKEEMQLFQASGGQFASSQNLFLAGKVAMVLQGPWMSTFIEEYAPGMEWSAAPFPPAQADMEPVTICEADVLVIPKGVEHREEAWDFIKFVQQRKNMEKLCIGQRKFSPLAEVSPEFYGKHPHPYIRVFRELAESPNAVGAPESSIYSQYRDEITNAFDLIWRLDSEPEQALPAVVYRIQPKLDRLNDQWQRVAEARKEEWAEL